MLENQTEISGLKSSLVKYFETENDAETAGILRASKVSSVEIYYDGRDDIYRYALLLELEISEFQKYVSKLDPLKGKILKVIEYFTQGLNNEFISEVRFAPLKAHYIDWSVLDGNITQKEILEHIESIKDIMISVSTGGPQIKTKESDYKKCYATLNDCLTKLGIENPNKFKSLWDWYGRWQQSDLPKYAPRRKFIKDLYQPVIEIIESSLIESTSITYEPTGWERVDRSVNEMKMRLAAAKAEEQFQAIGTLGRDTLISVAQQVFDANIHKTEDGVTPSNTDSKRMLTAYISYELSGKANECTRRYAKAAIDMANELTHDRTATKRDASMCLVAITAMASLINLIETSKEPVPKEEDDIPF